jgi:hypothetical protein
MSLPVINETALGARVVYAMLRIARMPMESVWYRDLMGAATVFGEPVADRASGDVSSMCNVAAFDVSIRMPGNALTKARD